MKNIKIGLWIAFLACLLMPVIVLFLSPRVRNTLFSEMLFELATSHAVKDERSDSSKAIAIFRYVHQHMHHQDKQHPVIDHSPFDILVSGYGACDQYANVMMNICRHAGMTCRITALYGKKPSSDHSISEVKIKGRWCMFDAYYGIYFLNERNGIASVDELKHMEKMRCSDNNLLPENYSDLYDASNSSKVLIHEPDLTTWSLQRFNARAMLAIFGEKFLNLYPNTFFKSDPDRIHFINRINQLLQ